MSNFDINDFKDLADIISANKESLKEVTASTNVGGSFAPLPDGYYLTELEEMNLIRTKNTNKPMISAKFRVQEDGKKLNDKKKLEDIPNVANRIIFQNWVINGKLEDPEGKSYKRYKSDALKLVEKDLDEEQLAQFSELLDDVQTLPSVFDALVGYQVWIRVTSKPDKTDPSKINTNSDLIDWKIITDLGISE